MKFRAHTNDQNSATLSLHSKEADKTTKPKAKLIILIHEGEQFDVPIFRAYVKLVLDIKPKTDLRQRILNISIL